MCASATSRTSTTPNANLGSIGSEPFKSRSTANMEAGTRGIKIGPMVRSARGEEPLVS
jgi:hypothetical protein